MAKYTKPKFYDLMEYVEGCLNSLVSIGDPSFRTFCEMNKIVNAVVYRESDRPEVGGYDGKHERVSFSLNLKFGPSVTPLRMLDDNAMLWLERWLGASLRYKGEEPYDEGGGYLHYEFVYPGSRQDEVFNQYDMHRYWTGGEWRG